MKWIKIFEDFNLNNISTINELVSKLKEYSIPIDNWGTGNAKTVEHLFDELKNQDCLIQDEGGYLVRNIEFVGIRILYKDKSNQTFILVEDRQEFKDGRIRKRNMPSSVSEKMKFGEDSLVAAIRGIREELSVKVESHQLK